MNVCDVGVEADLEVGHLPADRFNARELRDHAGDILRDRDRQEPHAHHHADDARDRQLGDHAEADRRDAQLGDRVDQIESGEPPQADLEIGTGERASPRRGTGSRRRRPTSAIANLTGIDGSRPRLRERVHRMLISGARMTMRSD